MTLSDAQIRFFHTFGYLSWPGLFDADEIVGITDEFEQTIQSVGGGTDHDGSQRTMFGGPIEHRPALCRLLDDERIKALASAALGDDFNYASGDGNYYSGDTGWHPDGNWGELFSCKVAFYLDPLTADTGALRVLPGSQSPDHFIRTEGIDPNDAEELFGVSPRDFPGVVVLESQPGDMVIFNHDLYHAAFGGSQRRRMFTMNLTRHCRTDEDRQTLTRYLSAHSPGCHDTDTGAGMFYPTMVDTAGETRRQHLQQCAELHDEMFPQFARRRA
ncbi:MAG: phytanoyl-CoA dioxygenase family protein [Candidatus Latescibacteria bacterium]|jgi:hypothetical protein|nr:hypothetical protein [Gemmatimonadaceae bacterium]MDP6015818.1 phytanoyl-CoA dioxygenase family protein [Candidatus Latescibacterota bacterium]MDP7450579.1 phytanoyl-CoA dioxygenase family protein [Candidatus Latescibacterota bacterium]HJP29132.1 phytanoyl-CoA dioxygenase family protein [Candidatus Latescibacterota bacterium]|tara:strand:- start:626 stop:1444 length:819 start_codon:yes stop_codon:yes gene_type:complete